MRLSLRPMKHPLAVIPTSVDSLTLCITYRPLRVGKKSDYPLAVMTASDYQTAPNMVSFHCHDSAWRPDLCPGNEHIKPGAMANPLHPVMSPAASVGPCIRNASDDGPTPLRLEPDDTRARWTRKWRSRLSRFRCFSLIWLQLHASGLTALAQLSYNGRQTNL
jgi:hypothetical protein